MNKDAQQREIRQWLVLWYPQAKVTKVVRLGQGLDAQVFGVTYKTQHGVASSALRIGQVPMNLFWRESLLLNTLYDQGLPVPRCHGVKQKPDNGQCCMLLDWLPGKAIGRPIDVATYVTQAAQVLHNIHSVRAPKGLPKYATSISRQINQVAKISQFQDLATALKKRLPKTHSEVLLHGDFWPGNLLFQRKQLTGVIDWSDACLGSALADVCNARVELHWLWGSDAMHGFSEAYFRISSVKARDLARWDLVALMKPILNSHRWSLSDAQTTRLNRVVESMVENALRSIYR